MGDKKGTGSTNAQESELGSPSGKEGVIPEKLFTQSLVPHQALATLQPPAPSSSSSS